MSKWEDPSDISVKCPYYKHKRDDGKKVLLGIVCEGLVPDSLSMITYFTSKEARSEHMDNFCRCGCWKGCPIAQRYE